MSNHRDLNVLDAAEQVADEINQLIDGAKHPLIHVGQLRDSAQSIGSNIREGFARGKNPQRNQSLRVAHGEAEETIGHLRANYRSGRIDRARFWRLRNRLITIGKMLMSIIGP